jgi:hypothetical protein
MGKRELDSCTDGLDAGIQLAGWMRSWDTAGRMDERLRYYTGSLQSNVILKL